DRAGGQLAEGLVRGSKYGEGACAFERFDQASGFHSGHQGSVIGGVDSVLDNVLAWKHFFAADYRVVHSGECGGDHQRDKAESGYQSSVHFKILSKEEICESAGVRGLETIGLEDCSCTPFGRELRIVTTESQCYCLV